MPLQLIHEFPEPDVSLSVGRYHLPGLRHLKNFNPFASLLSALLIQGQGGYGADTVFCESFSVQVAWQNRAFLSEVELRWN